MNSRFFVLLGTVMTGAVIWSCTENPTDELAGGRDRLSLEFVYREVLIADSVRTFAVESDAGGTPLPPTATVRSCNPAIAAVAPVSDAPLLRTGFYVKGVSFGSTCVITEAGTLADTMQVSTFPASIVVSSGPDTLLSGATATYGYTYRDARQLGLTGITPPSFSSNDTLRGKPQVTPLGAVLGLSPGVFTLTVRGVGSPPGGIAGTKIILVEPGVFAGGVSPTSGSPGEVVTVTNAVGGPGFDANTQAFFGGIRTFTANVTANSMDVVVPGIGVTGSVPFLMTQMGPANLAQSVSFTSNSASLADTYDAVNDDPGTAPEITANGDYYVVMSGSCSSGAGSGDCDDFFQITNTGGADADVTVTVSWFTGADIDAFGLDPTFDFCTYDGGCPAATGSNPEEFTMTVPAGQTWFIYLNLWDPHGELNSVTRVRVAGLP